MNNSVSLSNDSSSLFVQVSRVLGNHILNIDKKKEKLLSSCDD